jgi:ParB family chromosome partitioning protein
MISMIPISHVFHRPDARKVDPASVRSLMDSIGEVGIINPLRVRPKRCFIEGIEGDGYQVTAGVHRLTAARRLGLEEVPCIIVEDDDLHAELAMIDENLVRTDLDPALRAKQTSRRKAIKEELHPQTKHGGNLEGAGVANFATPGVERFTSETAKLTGRSERAIQLDAERGDKIADEVLDQVAGTHLATGTYLDQLKKKTVAEQVAKVQKDLANAARKQEQEKAARRAAKIDAGVQARAAQEVAEIIVEYIPADILDGLKVNMEAAGKIKLILDALSNLTGKSIMDTRYGEAA